MSIHQYALTNENAHCMVSECSLRNRYHALGILIGDACRYLIRQAPGDHDLDPTFKGRSK